MTLDELEKKCNIVINAPKLWDGHDGADRASAQLIKDMIAVVRAARGLNPDSCECVPCDSLCCACRQALEKLDAALQKVPK